ncbi:MAG: Ig-like domain-containing protein [Ruminococcus sp.]|nr:Ig-like domain-containing protein [Ruminococcus sp.]
MKIFKKSIAVFIAALMLISVMTFVSAAAEATVSEGQLKVTATSNVASETSATYYVSLTDTVTVTYKLTTALPIVNSEGELAYDSSVLKIKSISMPSVTNSMVNTEPADKAKFNHTVGEGEANFAEGADFVVAEFEVVGEGETKVDLQLTELNAEGEGAKFNELVLDGKAVSDAFSVSSVLSAPVVPETTEPAPTQPQVTEPQATEPQVVAPTLAANSVKLAAGKTYTIKVQNTTGKCVPTFTSNKKTVATVSKNGKVTALKKGNATITVKVAGKSLKLKVKVTSSPKIKVGNKKFSAKKTYTINKNGTIKVKITGKAAAINNKYKTSKKSVAKVTSNAKATTVKIKGIKKGTAKITLTVNKVQKFTIKVKVK